MTIAFLFTLLAAAGPTAPAGRVVVFRDQGPTGSVVVSDPTGALPNEHPAALQGIALLPIEANGRTALERLLPDRPRLIEDIPGAGRLALPQGGGSLYRFGRPEIEGATFGFLLVDATGDARSVFERPGFGPLGDQDPFVPRVAVAPDGASFLVATLRPAGGDLFEVDLASGTALERTTGLPPVRFQETGLALHDTWGIAVSGRGVWRFDRAGSADAEAVPFTGGLPDWFEGDLVLSRNGQHAATVAGDAPTSAHVWSFGPTGAAACNTVVPTTISGAGFLPEATDGPYLAVSDDGSHCAWREEAAGSHEAFLAPSLLPPVQVSADMHYLDTLDEIGQFLFIPLSNRLVFAIGETNLEGPPAVEKVDYYEVVLDAQGVPTFTNLTGTSGDLVAPFDFPGAIDPIDAVLHPTDARVLIHNDMSGGTGELLLFEPGTAGMTTFLPDVKSLDFAAVAAGNLLVSVERGDLGTRQLWHAGAAWTSPTMLFNSPPTTTFSRVAERADGIFGFVRTAQAEFVHLYDSTTGQLSLLTSRPLAYGPNLSFSPDGDLVLAVGQSPIPSVFARWTPGGPVARLPVASTTGFVLPGI